MTGSATLTTIDIDIDIDTDSVNDTPGDARATPSDHRPVIADLTP